MEQEIKVFPCYSVPLMEYITKQKNIKYVLIGLHPETHKKFWLFIKDKQLNNILTEWKETKPQG